MKLGVIVIKQETTMQELQQFATVCKERFGIEAFQIHIHKDEGHLKQTSLGILAEENAG